MSQGWRKYAANEIKTSNPVKVTIMAYERCLLNIRFAKECYEKEDYDLPASRLDQTNKLINELTMQLNRNEKAPMEVKELVESMDFCYQSILYHIEEFQLKKDLKAADTVIKVLQNLLEGYRGANDQE